VLDDTGLVKLWVISRALRARRERPELFRRLHAIGGRRAETENTWSLSTAEAQSPSRPGCRSACPQPVAGATTVLPLPPGQYRDVFTGSSCSGELALADALGEYPVALFTGREVLMPEVGVWGAPVQLGCRSAIGEPGRTPPRPGNDHRPRTG